MWISDVRRDSMSNYSSLIVCLVHIYLRYSDSAGTKIWCPCFEGGDIVINPPPKTVFGVGGRILHVVYNIDN